MNDLYIQQYNDEYQGDMSKYVISYLKDKLGDIATNFRVIIENQNPVILFSTKYHDCEIYEFSGSHGEDYWVVSMIDREPDE